jgi:hypothetical protein
MRGIISNAKSNHAEEDMEAICFLRYFNMHYPLRLIYVGGHNMIKLSYAGVGGRKGDFSVSVQLSLLIRPFCGCHFNCKSISMQFIVYYLEFLIS